VGLFGYIGMGTVISRLGIVNANVTGSQRTGILVGGAIYTSYISDVFVTGTVSGTTYVGSFLGARGSYFFINNSYSTATVTGTGNQVGGLAGSGDRVDNSFSVGAVSSAAATTFVGPILGDNGNLTGSYFNQNATCTNCTNTNGNAIDTILNPTWFFTSTNAPLTSWDFNYIWQASGTNYPVFK